MSKKYYPNVVTIAGSDPSGGAGIQADIKAISATGSYATSVITVLTAQNTQGVTAINKISADFVFQQMESIFVDLTIHAVKIGMLYDHTIINAVKCGLEKFKPKNIVLDPVMLSKSGYELLPTSAIDCLKTIFPLVDLITPNILEVEKLLNFKINDYNLMQQAACNLATRYKTNVLLKGGHLINCTTSTDVLYHYAQQQTHWFHANRLTSKHTHGTGCTLSAAIASYLAQGYTLKSAIQLAKNYLHQAIIAGEYLQIGHGIGPVDHFFKYKIQQ